MSTFGYRPDGMKMWDTWYLEHQGRAHVYYLQRLRSDSHRTEREADSLGHAVSDDLVHWEERPLALPPGPAGSQDDLQPWTGCAVAHEGSFYLYYTMRAAESNGVCQRIGLARSDDLDHWERYPGNPIITPDPQWYVSEDAPLPGGIVDCRDLLVVPDPEGRGWLGFYAAMTPAEELPEGAVIAAVRSDDLIHWEHLPPAYAPKKYSVMEVPDVFYLDGSWYMTCLVGHFYGNRGLFCDPHPVRGTIYAVADRPEGPYREIEDDNVLMAGDSEGGYSCRSLMFEGQRYIFYTQTIPSGAILSPPMRVCTIEGGRLRLAWSERTEAYRRETLVAPDCPPSIASLPACMHHWRVPTGRWRLEDGCYIGECRTGWQVADLGVGAADVDIEARIAFEGAAAGLVWRAEIGRDHCSTSDLTFLLEATDSTVRSSRPPLFEHPAVRSLPLATGRPYRIRVCVRRPWFEIYVDDLLVQQFCEEMPESTRPSIGLFVDRGRARVDELCVHALAAD